MRDLAKRKVKEMRLAIETRTDFWKEMQKAIERPMDCETLIHLGKVMGMRMERRRRLASDSLMQMEKRRETMKGLQKGRLKAMARDLERPMDLPRGRETKKVRGKPTVKETLKEKLTETRRPTERRREKVRRR